MKIFTKTLFITDCSVISLPTEHRKNTAKMFIDNSLRSGFRYHFHAQNCRNMASEESKSLSSQRHRVPGFLSSRPNWLHRPPYPHASVAPPLVPRGVTHSLAGEGAGGAKSDEGKDTLVL
jgi:hypothetical protein